MGYLLHPTKDRKKIEEKDQRLCCIGKEHDRLKGLEGAEERRPGLEEAVATSNSSCIASLNAKGDCGCNAEVGLVPDL